MQKAMSLQCTKARLRDIEERKGMIRELSDLVKKQNNADYDRTDAKGIKDDGV
jgi:hypothetical protein